MMSKSLMTKSLLILCLIMLGVLLAVHLHAQGKGQGKGQSKKNLAPVPQTGQTTCVDEIGEINDCEGTGQDGEFQAGIPDPDPRFTLYDNGTVIDNRTSLMWTEDAQQIPGSTMTWPEALAACNSLVFADYDDWRLANIRELYSLVNFGAYNPALPEYHPFLNVLAIPPSDYGFYWSSTYHYNTGNWAWVMQYREGISSPKNWTDPTNVGGAWCVRGGELAD